MNRRPAIAPAALLASLALILLAAPAAQAAGIPHQMVLDTFSVRGCPCTFVMTGALEDQGSIVTDSVQPHALTSPIVGTATTVRTFIGQHGSLTIRLQSIIAPTENPDLYTESGSWVILETTGAYAGVDGWGKEAGVRDFAHQSLDVTYTGLLH